MSGSWKLAPTSIEVNGASAVLILVLAPWVAVFAILYLMFKGVVTIQADGSVAETEPPPYRTPGLVIAGLAIILGLVALLASVL